MERVSLIPEEAVEANLADLKRFITDGARKAVCKLGLDGSCTLQKTWSKLF